MSFDHFLPKFIQKGFTLKTEKYPHNSHTWSYHKKYPAPRVPKAISSIGGEEGFDNYEGLKADKTFHAAENAFATILKELNNGKPLTNEDFPILRDLSLNAGRPRPSGRG